MNLFWLVASGILFLLAGIVFWRVLMSPSNISRHLWATTGSCLAFILTGQVFGSLLVAKFLL